MPDSLKNKILTIKNIKSISLLGFICSLVLPFSLWIIEIALWKTQISFSSILFIHLKSPSLFIVDLIPFILVIFIYYFLKNFLDERAYYNSEIRQMQERMDITAQFAKEIGEGNYHSEFSISSDTDILGKSLLLMRNNLLMNNKKEAEQNWIAEGKEKISYILRLHNKINDLAYEVIVNLISYINAIQGAFYIYDDERNKIVNVSTFAYSRKKYINQEFSLGEGLVGECATKWTSFTGPKYPIIMLPLLQGFWVIKNRKACYWSH